MRPPSISLDSHQLRRVARVHAAAILDHGYPRFSHHNSPHGFASSRIVLFASWLVAVSPVPIALTETGSYAISTVFDIVLRTCTPSSASFVASNGLVCDPCSLLFQVLHMMGFRPFCNALSTFLLTVSSVSAKYWRRSGAR